MAKRKTSGKRQHPEQVVTKPVEYALFGTLYSPPVAMSLARAHEKASQWEKAIEAYTTLLKRFPNSAYVYYGLLNLYAKKGDPEKTIEYENKLKEASTYGDKGIYDSVKKK